MYESEWIIINFGDSQGDDFFVFILHIWISRQLPKPRALFMASMAHDSSGTQIESELDDLSMDDSIRIIHSISITAASDDDFVAHSSSQRQTAPENMRMDVAPELINEISLSPINQPAFLDHLSQSDLAEIIECLRSFWPDIQGDPFVCLQCQLPFSLLYPRCFGSDPKQEIAFVSVDGNFQHRRFPTSKIDDDIYLKDQDRRLFIGINHTKVTPDNIELAKYAKMPNCDSDSDIKKTPCGRHFKAV